MSPYFDRCFLLTHHPTARCSSSFGVHVHLVEPAFRPFRSSLCTGTSAGRRSRLRTHPRWRRQRHGQHQTHSAQVLERCRAKDTERCLLNSLLPSPSSWPRAMVLLRIQKGATRCVCLHRCSRCIPNTHPTQTGHSHSHILQVFLLGYLTSY